MKNTMSLQLQLYGLLDSTANDREITCDKSRLNTPALWFAPMSDCHYSFNLVLDASFTDLSPHMAIFVLLRACGRLPNQWL